MVEEATSVKVARLEVHVDGLRKNMDNIQATLAGQDDKLDRLLAIHHRRKGATAVTKTMLGLVSSGGLLGWLWEHFHK